MGGWSTPTNVIRRFQGGMIKLQGIEHGSDLPQSYANLTCTAHRSSARRPAFGTVIKECEKRKCCECPLSRNRQRRLDDRIGRGSDIIASESRQTTRRGIQTETLTECCNALGRFHGSFLFFANVRLLRVNRNGSAAAFWTSDNPADQNRLQNMIQANCPGPCGQGDQAADCVAHTIFATCFALDTPIDWKAWLSWSTAWIVTVLA